MNLIEALKGVWNRMIKPKTVENVLHIQPTISPKMQEAIELWESMYKNESPWLTENVKSLGLASMIASEKARMATLEMEIKITGEGERADYVREQFDKVLSTIRKNLEYGIALGSLVIKPYVLKGPDGKYTMEFNYTKANNFYPLSFSAEGNITEAAFIDRIITKEFIYSKLEYHQLSGNEVIVRNLAFKIKNNNLNPISAVQSELGTPISLTEVPAWASLAPEVTISNIDRLLFAYFKMPQANNVDLESPLGVSGFSRAVGLIKNADEQYSNLLWEFEGGQLAVDVDRTALNPMKNTRGEITEVLPKLQDRLFRRNLDLGDDNTYNVFSPQLRDSSIINGLNNILMHIEDVCDLSRGTISQADYAEARTATELKILKQRSYAANADIQRTLQETLEDVLDIIDNYCDLYTIVPSGDYEVAFKWDDSIIVDKDAERQVDLLDVNAGLLSKVEYRMKWMGETKDQAEAAIKEINDEKQELMQLQQQALAQTKSNNNTSENENSSSSSEAEAEQQKRQRANESNETTSENN